MDNSLTSNMTEGASRINLHDLKDFKDARKLAKLNKLDDNNTDLNQDFKQKISNKLGVDLNSSKSKSVAPKKVEGPRRVYSLRNLPPKKNEPSSQGSTTSSHRSLQPVVERNSIDLGMSIVGKGGSIKAVSRRNPEENKWKKRLESDQQVLKDTLQEFKGIIKADSDTVKSSTRETTPIGSSESKNLRGSAQKMREGTPVGKEKSRNSSVSSVKSGNKGIEKTEVSVKKEVKGTRKGRFLGGGGSVTEKKERLCKSKENERIEEMKEENMKLIVEKNKQRAEMERIRKEKESLARKLVSIENQKQELEKIKQMKEVCLKETQCEVELMRKQLVMCKRDFE